jgi:hypothetical protein
MILIINLFLGTIFTLQTWNILKNNYEITYSWGKGDYKLWLTIIIFSILFVIAKLYISFFFYYAIYLIFLSVSFFYLLIIHTMLSNLDKSVNYKFNIYDLEKLRSYFFLFICQWVSFFFFLRKLKFYDNKFYINILFIIGIGNHISLYIKGEIFYFFRKKH